MRRGLIERNTPPEWNIQVMTEDDLYYYCDRAGIAVREMPLEQYGLYMLCGDRPYIFIQDELRGADQLFTAWHELAHYWLHPPRIQFFKGWDALSETEADIVAACAMIPITVLVHNWPGEIAEFYGYPLKLVELRREIFDLYQI